MKKGNNHLTRRELLKGAAGMGMMGAVSPIADFAGYNLQKKGLIAEENRRAGTTDWQLIYVKSNNCRSALIEGYCSKTSLRAGEPLDIFLSAEGLSREKKLRRMYGLIFIE